MEALRTLKIWSQGDINLTSARPLWPKFCPFYRLSQFPHASLFVYRVWTEYTDPSFRMCLLIPIPGYLFFFSHYYFLVIFIFTQHSEGTNPAFSCCKLKVKWQLTFLLASHFGSDVGVVRIIRFYCSMKATAAETYKQAKKKKRDLSSRNIAFSLFSFRFLIILHAANRATSLAYVTNAHACQISVT